MIWANRSLDLITIGSAIYDNTFFLSWSEQTWQTVTVHGSVCSFCVRLCGWTRSLCLSALPSDRAPDEVIRTVTGVARLHCLYLAGVSVVRCQIVFTLVVFLLSVSVFQVRRLFSPGRVSVFPWRVRTGLYSLPELETLHCRVYCTCTAGDICTSTVFWSLHLHCRWYLHLHCVLESAPALPAYLHLHCVLELSNKDYLFSLAIGSRAFCSVTQTWYLFRWQYTVKILLWVIFPRLDY